MMTSPGSTTCVAAYSASVWPVKMVPDTIRPWRSTNDMPKSCCSLMMTDVDVRSIAASISWIRDFSALARTSMVTGSNGIELSAIRSQKSEVSFFILAQLCSFLAWGWLMKVS